MSYIRDAIHNQVLISAALSWLIAQVLKVLIDGIRNGFSAERLAGGGGMPSSHSATVAGLTTATVLVYGCGGFEFVMALFFAIIVIYDAAGVRMETGREAKVLNLLCRRDLEEGRKPVYDRDLQEKMGHTVPEILAGIVIGVACGAVVCNVIF